MHCAAYMQSIADEVPPLDGEKDGLKYLIRNLDLTRIRLLKENVKIQLSDALGKMNPVRRLKRRRARLEMQVEQGTPHEWGRQG